MSDRPIQAGDLVVVVKVKECCGGGKLGNIFRVGYVGPSPTGNLRCVTCKTIFPVDVMATEVGFSPSKDGTPIHRLKRIPPLDELESTKDTERLKETA